MQITNEILHAFIHCPYKAYRKNKSENGEISDYEKLFQELKDSQKLLFSERLSSENKLIKTQPKGNNFSFKEGTILNSIFSNSNIEIIPDGIEFIGKNKIIPIILIPFEKITRTDKLFVSFQATYLQNEFHFQIEHCKIVFGKTCKQTKFKISSFSKAIKKNISELNKILIQSNPPIFYRNNHCQICEFQNSCLEKLKERDDLSLLTGLKPKEILQKNNRGIFSVKQLSYTFRPKKNPHRKRKFLPELKALAIRENKTFIHEIPMLPSSQTEIFFDIEGLPDRNFYYLIGVVIKTDDSEKTFSFWANNESEEERIFIEFINLLKPLEDFTIYHYGSYEIQALKSILKKMHQEYKVLIAKIIEKSYNLLNVFAQNIYPPTYSNSLKEIARFLNFEWTEKDASGLQSTIWRYNWELIQNENLKNKLITYNIEDCSALISLKKWLLNIPNNENDHFKQASNFIAVSTFKWGNNDFLINEFNQINKFAYFKYQRDKIYIKTFPEIAKLKRKTDSKKKNSHIVLKPDKIVQNQLPNNCPKCNGTQFYLHDQKHKTVIDLKVTKTGMKKIVIQYHTGRFRCKSCLWAFNSKENLDIPIKYGRTLNCWLVNLSVQYRISYRKISDLLKEIFDINLNETSIKNAKLYFSEYYKSTITEILNTLNNNSLLHVDETTFTIGKEKCFIWAFTNMNTVYYLFRETRESDFLKEILQDFKGVLVSDFYAGYDALDCPKQRCLIHLIRDMNDDLVKNQQNEEFKILITKFSILLNEIIFTVNRYGLKKRNLTKHKKVTNSYFKYLKLNDFETEICEKWQKRLLSSEHELFTFLNYDGIPWNNNNAEVAIKAVAVYRRDVDGLPSQKSIQEHLTLLSINQTCKYRGINFFEFLRSGEKSILEFSKKHK